MKKGLSLLWLVICLVACSAQKQQVTQSTVSPSQEADSAMVFDVASTEKSDTLDIWVETYAYGELSDQVLAQSVPVSEVGTQQVEVLMDYAKYGLGKNKIMLKTDTDTVEYIDQFKTLTKTTLKEQYSFYVGYDDLPLDTETIVGVMTFEEGASVVKPQINQLLNQPETPDILLKVEDLDLKTIPRAYMVKVRFNGASNE